MENSELKHLVEQVISGAYTESVEDEDYQSEFSSEGGRKARYIIDDLRYKKSKLGLKLSKLCYFSIGGADGSEVIHVLNETSINKAVLLEISDSGVERARIKAKELYEKSGKELIVVQGDAFAHLDKCLKAVKGFIAKGEIDGLVVSAQAVLHELPKRSKGYDQSIFLGKLYNVSDLNHYLFYSREPCIPREWPERVRIRIDGLSNDDLYRLACHVRDRLQIPGTPEVLAGNWLDLESILAVETLHKLIRGGTVTRIEYELGEQLTQFDPISVKLCLESIIDGMSVDLDYVTTLGFKRALGDFNVEYVGHHSEPLPCPKTHVEIIGHKISRPSITYTGHRNMRGFHSTQNDDISYEKPTDRKPIFNPFDGDISSDEIAIYLSQFTEVEASVMAKVVEKIQYVSHKKLETICKQLYSQVLSQYEKRWDKLSFVQFGNASKSSGMITYLFRTINKIPASKFITSHSIGDNLLNDQILVFIDDLLASGHQAQALLGPYDRQRANELCFATLVSCDQGVELLQERTNVNVISAIRIGRIDSPLHPENKLLTEREKQLFKKIIQDRPPRSQFSVYGYADLSLSLGFYYNTPDNTFPIFWSQDCTQRPLMNRDSLGRPTI